MRYLLALALVPASAFADVSVGASIGAGAQGRTAYSALDLRFDAAWPDITPETPEIRLGLGARGVWDDSTFRTSDWASPWHAITIVRDFEARYDLDDTELALAAGALAPAQLSHIVNGYRVALDDRWRTGVRTAAQNEDLTASLELDDVLDPALAAGGVRWFMAPPWGAHLALAVDPRAPAMAGPQTPVAIEAGLDHRLQAEDAELAIGAAVVAELTLGASLVAFGEGAIDWHGVRWTGRADVRVGTGTNGAMFGPLYRIERLAHDGAESTWDRARAGELSGAGAGIALGAAIPFGWLELGARARPGIGPLFTINGGAPMGRWVQAGVWGAIGERDAAGAAEVRIAWAKTLFSALQAARVYRLDDMDPRAVWSLTAWFGATTE